MRFNTGLSDLLGLTLGQAYALALCALIKQDTLRPSRATLYILTGVLKINLINTENVDI